MFSPSTRILCNNLKICQNAVVTLRLSKNNFYTNRSVWRQKFGHDATKTKNLRSTLYYITAAGVVVVGLSYAAVPLYRLFCQATSYGGTPATGHDSSKVATMSPLRNKPIKIKFNADTAASMRWNFKPQQSEITVSNY